MTTTPKVDKASPGWYSDPRWPGEQRRWDGTRWLDDWRPAAGIQPGTVMAVGLAAALAAGILAGIVLAAGADWGWLVLWIGAGIASVVFSVGLIGKGVEIGIRAARH